jgi:hypothetical protein
MFRGNRPARSVGGSTKNQFVYRKYNHAAKAQPPGRASKQQADLTAVWRDAEALCAKLKGSK